MHKLEFVANLASRKLLPHLFPFLCDYNIEALLFLIKRTSSTDSDQDGNTDNNVQDHIVLLGLGIQTRRCFLH